MHLTRWIALVGAGLLSVSAAASAQVPPPPPSAADAKVRVPAVVAAGGRYAVAQRGLAVPARIEIRVDDGAWHAVGRSLKRPPARLRLRARRQPTVVRVRGRGADGFVTPVRRLRVRYLRMAAVGDINLGDGPGAQIALRGNDYPWTSVGSSLRAADLAFGNLESAVSRRGAPVQKQFTFRGRPGALRAAARTGGLDVVNLANNHAGDYGDAALLDTLRYARRFGLATVGAGRDAAHAYRPRIVRRLGLRIAFVGFSEVLPFGFRARAREPGTAWAFPDRIRRTVRRARRQADVVIATFHWGIERATRPTARQRELAQLTLRSGATAVIAAHPHVLQPIRRRPGRLIAYSLGNFVFSAASPGTQNTGILHLRLASGRVASSSFQRATIVNSRPVLDR